MFEYFGGIPEIVVPDNLKSGATNAHQMIQTFMQTINIFANIMVLQLFQRARLPLKIKQKLEEVCILLSVKF